MKKYLLVPIIILLLILTRVAIDLFSKPPDSLDLLLQKQALEIVDLFQKKDMTSLSTRMHPNKGIRFSLYGNVNLETDNTFSQSEIKTALQEQDVIQWGFYDGSGEPIDLTFEDFLKTFITDSDFSKAPKINVDQVIGKGNTIQNHQTVYPKSHFVELHFPGFDPKYEGLDWKSLRFVFEELENQWYLVGIIRDQWTI